jgi:hypothetical protein
LRCYVEFSLVELGVGAAVRRLGFVKLISSYYFFGLLIFEAICINDEPAPHR